MKIVVIGSGYVGTTAAGIFSLSGHSVIAIDIDRSKVDLINKGQAPFYEAGLNEILSEGVKSNALKATSDYSSSIRSADIVFSCVGTPDNPDGSSNLEYVYEAAKEAAKYLKKGALYVQKSTVPVGTGRRVMSLLPEHVGYVSNPEFLRESTAIYDTLFFDRVVAGSDDLQASEAILDVHRSVEKNALHIAKVASIPCDYQSLEKHTGEYRKTQLESAELIKVTANAFLALKISFANSIAKLCDATGANIKDVMGVVGSDSRIGPAFFNAGRGYGGGCFPKDVSGLISSAKEHDLDMEIMSAATRVNASMPDYIIDRVINNLGSLRDKKVAVLGLAFKSNTSDARKSPAVTIANKLVQLGSSVSVYDPEAREEASHDLDTSIKVLCKKEDALTHAEVIFIATDWKEFIDVENWTKIAPSATLLVDCVNCITLKPDDAIEYLGVGKKL